MKYIITFLRHGRSEGIDKNVLQGHLDYPLTERGRNETFALAKYWGKNEFGFDLIISSPLARAYETGKIISETLNVPIETDKIWIERHFGNGQGEEINKVLNWYQGKPFPTCFDPIYDTGESDWEIHLRAGKAIANILTRQPGKYLIVSHGNFLNATMHMIMGVLPQGRSPSIVMSLDNTGYSTCIYDTEEKLWYIKNFNIQAHLDL